MRKKIIWLFVAAVLVLAMAAAASAEDTGTNFSGRISKTLDLQPGSDFQYLTLDPSQSYNIWYSVTAHVQYAIAKDDGGSAMLASNHNSGRIWQIYLRDNNQNWNLFDSLISAPMTASKSSPLDPVSVSAPDEGYLVKGYSGIGIGYDLDLSRIGAGTATCSGDGTLTAAAVPEPSSILAATTVLAPLGFALRRRRI